MLQDVLTSTLHSCLTGDLLLENDRIPVTRGGGSWCPFRHAGVSANFENYCRENAVRPRCDDVARLGYLFIIVSLGARRVSLLQEILHLHPLHCSSFLECTDARRLNCICYQSIVVWSWCAPRMNADRISTSSANDLQGMLCIASSAICRGARLQLPLFQRPYFPYPDSNAGRASLKLAASTLPLGSN